MNDKQKYEIQTIRRRLREALNSLDEIVKIDKGDDRKNPKCQICNTTDSMEWYRVTEGYLICDSCSRKGTPNE